MAVACSSRTRRTRIPFAFRTASRAMILTEKVGFRIPTACSLGATDLSLMIYHSLVELLAVRHGWCSMAWYCYRLGMLSMVAYFNEA